MLGQLAQCEFTVKKSQFSRKMMQEELKNYKAISRTIDGGIEQAKDQIIQSKKNLEVAKKIRRNRMEYDALSKIIAQHPDRKETTLKLKTLERDLEELSAKQRELERETDSRRDDFTVLMRSLRELQRKLDASQERSNDSDGNRFDGDEGMIIDIA